MIQAQVVADSINPFGDRITSMLVTFPRIILSELNTHRMFSRNSASSRAIPTKRMLEMIKENPFIPIAWQKEHKGMQGTEYFTDPKDIQREIEYYLEDRDVAIMSAKRRVDRGVTKQIANRPLEAYMWTTVLVTSTEWDNFFELRCPQYWLGNPMDIRKAKSRKDAIQYISEYGFAPVNKPFNIWTDIDWLKMNQGQAEIHMMALAEAMWDAKNESKPKELKAGEWHIPFEDKISISQERIYDLIKDSNILRTPYDTIKVQISTAMAARTSYTTVGEEKEVSYETLIGIHDKMAIAKPFHASPFEHCSRAMSESELDNYLKIEDGKTSVGWCRNFKGFIQYRALLEATSSTSEFHS